MAADRPESISFALSENDSPNNEEKVALSLNTLCDSAAESVSKYSRVVRVFQAQAKGHPS